MHVLIVSKFIISIVCVCVLYALVAVSYFLEIFNLTPNVKILVETICISTASWILEAVW